LKPNYEFIMKSLSIEMANSTKRAKSKVLDFGCGVGEVVEEGVKRGINMYGVDTFDGYYSDWKDKLPESIVDKVSKIENNRIDFEDNTFDYVISNQVFEHISDYVPSMKEIRRVLKSGGVLLTVFPNYEVWYEGHIGLYFPHRFRAHSYMQRKYLTICYKLGLGRKRHMGIDGWMNILNDVTFHHKVNKINSDIFNIFHGYPEDIIEEFLEYRISLGRLPLGPLFKMGLMKKIMIFIAKTRAGSTLRVVNKKEGL